MKRNIIFLVSLLLLISATVTGEYLYKKDFENGIKTQLEAGNIKALKQSIKSQKFFAKLFYPKQVIEGLEDETKRLEIYIEEDEKSEIEVTKDKILAYIK